MYSSRSVAPRVRLLSFSYWQNSDWPGCEHRDAFPHIRAVPHVCRRVYHLNRDNPCRSIVASVYVRLCFMLPNSFLGRSPPCVYASSRPLGQAGAVSLSASIPASLRARRVSRNISTLLGRSSTVKRPSRCTCMITPDKRQPCVSVSATVSCSMRNQPERCGVAMAMRAAWPLPRTCRHRGLWHGWAGRPATWSSMTTNDEAGSHTRHHTIVDQPLLAMTSS